MAFKVDYFVRETGTNLRRNLTLTLASLITVAVSLALFGVALWLRGAVDNASARWQGGVEFIVFMNPDASQAQIDAVGRKLDDNPQVSSHTFLDKNQAYEDFQTLFPNSPQFTAVLRPEDLPTSYRVVPSTADAAVIDAVGRAFSREPGVYSVQFAKDTIDRLQRLTGFLQVLAFGAAMVLLVAAGMLILNTIRTAMFARRREIEVMKLVGATNWFIRVPFMLEGLVTGLIGGGLAWLGVWGAHRWFEQQLSEGGSLTFLANLSVTTQEIRTVGLTVVLVGVVVGTVGSGIAVSKFLDV